MPITLQLLSQLGRVTTNRQEELPTKVNFWDQCHIINIPQPVGPFLYLSFASVQQYSPTAVTILVAHHVLCGTPQLSCLTQSKNVNIKNCSVQEKTNFEYQPIHWEEGKIQGVQSPLSLTLWVAILLQYWTAISSLQAKPLQSIDHRTPPLHRPFGPQSFLKVL